MGLEEKNKGRVLYFLCSFSFFFFFFFFSSISHPFLSYEKENEDKKLDDKRNGARRVEIDNVKKSEGGEREIERERERGEILKSMDRLKKTEAFKEREI